MYMAALLAVSLPNRSSQMHQSIKSQRNPVHTEAGDPLCQAGVILASLSPSSDGVKQNCYRKSAAPAHPCCSPLLRCLPSPASPSTGAKSWVKTVTHLKNNGMAESIVS